MDSCRVVDRLCDAFLSPFELLEALRLVRNVQNFLLVAHRDVVRLLQRFFDLQRFCLLFVEVLFYTLRLVQFFFELGYEDL